MQANDSFPSLFIFFHKDKESKENEEKEIILPYIFKYFAEPPVLSKGGAKCLLPRTSYLCSIVC